VNKKEIFENIPWHMKVCSWYILMSLGCKIYHMYNVLEWDLMNEICEG
jgi:hypothetical protein